MRDMNGKEIDMTAVLKAHSDWVMGCIGGSRANLSRADLYGADLSRANLYGADLSRANLYGADLSRANLCGANLCGANLYRANLCGANLYGADLYGADLCGANLSRADLCGADLCGARNADLALIRTSIVPEVGAFEAWKKLYGGHVAHLAIPKKAKRCNATGRKCRASLAKVIAIYTAAGKKTTAEVSSLRDESFKYKVGKVVKPKIFEEDRWIECAGGIHFFITRAEAEAYV